MTLETLSQPAAATNSSSPRLSGELLDREVAEFMTPGCVVISEAASVADAARTLETHQVHAVLVVGSRNGTPLGWVTANGLLGWVGRDREVARARDAITEQVTAIAAHERIRMALYALSLAGTTHLLVRSRPNRLPEGVLSAYDLAVAARR